jgi:RNA recognition motif-containing protein
VKKVFSQFGEIEDIRKFQEKGYVFVKFSTKEAAANAIIAVHNTNVNGYTVKCSWGREKPPPSEQFDLNFNVVPAQQYLYGPQQQLGYYGYSQPMGSSFQSVPLLQNPYYPSNFGYQPAQYLANYGGLQQGWDWNARLVSADYNGAVTTVPETTSQQMNWNWKSAAVAGRPETPEIPTHKI